MSTNSTQQQLGEVRHVLGEHRHHIDELYRKSKGNTNAMARAATLEARLENIEAELTRVSERFETIGTDGVQAHAFTDELNRLGHRLDQLWSDLDSELNQLKGRVDSHEDRLNGHDTLFQELESNLTIVGRSTASAHARINVLSRRVYDTPAWVYLVGIIGGIIAAILFNNQDWKETVKNGDQTITVAYTYADSWWAMTLVGVGVAAVIIGLLGLIVRRYDTQEDNAEAQAEATAFSEVAVTHNRNAGRDDNHTVVQPTADTPDDQDHTHAGAPAQA